MDFYGSYDKVLAGWPAPVTPVDVPTGYGTTRVNVCGPAGGRPLVLLHGGGATSTVWRDNVAGRRVYAIDQINDAGRSAPGGRPARTFDDLMAWMDAVLDGLGLESAVLCGHSYGGRLALGYALHAPHRVSHLVLLDPSTCFAGMSLPYLLRAIPLFLPGPKAQRTRAFLRWETGGAALDPDWSELFALAAAEPKPKIVQPRLPESGRLRELDVPTLVLVAEKSKSHDPAKVAAGARALLPRVRVETLAGATHHTVPLGCAEDINQRLDRFLAQ